MPSPNPPPKTPIHFVGSLPLPSPSKVFTHLPSSLPPNTLKRLPDGEPGARGNFTGWQWGLFASQGLGPALTQFDDGTTQSSQHQDWSAQEIEEVLREVPMVLDTGYDEAALESWELFKQAKLTGSVAHETRFQVSIPTPTNFLPFGVLPAFQRAVEPRYAAGLEKAVRNTQKAIPHGQLAIQLDMAVEFALLHGAGYPGWPDGQAFIPKGENVMDALVDKVFRLASVVDADVELGFHCCYGDVGAKHFLEPPDTGMIATFLRCIIEKLRKIGRPINWIHFPVPKDRDDAAYLLPLKSLLEELDESMDVFVGLVHAEDLEGTKRRMEMARNVFGGRGFGVATECGIGAARHSEAELEGVLEIMREVCGG